MAITLGTNIPSYTARRYLNNATNSLTQTMERLSSGSKLNRAGDDAAGLVISQNMEALTRGSKQAQANIETATSFLNVAEDGMVSISEHFQRINDLLVNMANDTNDIDSRTAAIMEIIERIDEINRLADSTNFNGKTMLDGSADSIIVQMGADETETSILDISSALTDCHVKALNAELPGYLNPEGRAEIDADGNVTGDIYVPKEITLDDGTVQTYYLPSDSEDVNDAITEDEYNALESAFEPNNENCRKYMALIQGAIAEIATRRGLLGAYENRMDSAYDSMTIRIESLESAKTVYTDTDIAEEATNLVSRQIMQQYDVAILSSANSMPQLALSLLGG